MPLPETLGTKRDLLVAVAAGILAQGRNIRAPSRSIVDLRIDCDRDCMALRAPDRRCLSHKPLELLYRSVDGDEVELMAPMV